MIAGGGEESRMGLRRVIMKCLLIRTMCHEGDLQDGCETWQRSAGAGATSTVKDSGPRARVE